MGDSGGTVTLAVILAAGSGSRFTGSGHKLEAEIAGKPILETTVMAAAEADIGDVLVITGAIQPILPDLPNVETRHNPDWAEGQATSLQTAIAEAVHRGVDAIVVGLGDQPFVMPEAWRLVAASESPIAVATYDGLPRNPVRLHRSVWPLMPTIGDQGARSVARLRGDLTEEISCPGSPADIDTLEDLRKWQKQ